MGRSWLISVCLLAAGPGLSQSGIDVDASVRTEFATAYRLARAGLTSDSADSPALRNYTIYAYLEAARLGRDLAATGAEWSDEDDAVAAFLERHDGKPVSINLRVAWLDSLAARELWPRFLEQYRDDLADTALRCRYLAARIAQGEVTDISPEILDEWLTPYQLPLACEPVFQWLRDDGALNDETTESRVRLLLENGQAAFARVIARPLPEMRARPLLTWADLIERPLTSITSYVDEPSAEIEPRMLLDGWSRLTRDNPEAALGLHDSLIATRGLGSDGSSPYTLALALGLAWDRRPEALDYFARIAEPAIDDYALAWQTRAALWAGEWALARRSIAAMSSGQRTTAQWRYWAARVSEERDERESLYESLAPNDNYFSAAAAAQMRDRPETHPVSHAADPATVARLARIPAVARAGELRQVGLPIAATREWRFAYAGLSGDEREQSVHVASNLGWFDLAVATATDLGIFYDYRLLYPRPYADEVDAAADEFGLEPALIYAVIRQESLYRPDAESSAGARGLMQLRRGTVDDVVRRLDDESARGLDALDPGVNIRFGAARLASLLERFDGNLVLALAGYNAGPAAVERWLPEGPVEGDIWLENVPYNETRQYVRQVLWHSVVFASLENDRVNAREWLREIEPR